jgi:hypothetical protein
MPVYACLPGDEDKLGRRMVRPGNLQKTSRGNTKIDWQEGETKTHQALPSVGEHSGDPWRSIVPIDTAEDR